jgi:hypothetical protein
MIHGTWTRGPGGVWEVKIPWDVYWGNSEPQPMDIVLVESKSGVVKEIQIADVARVRFDWVCSVYDEKYIGCENYGDYDEEWMEQPF